MSEIYIIAFESSCDDTSVALYEQNSGLVHYLTHSQNSTHEKYGGVVPELASRDHIAVCLALLDKVLNESGVDIKDIASVAYTAGPGLIGSLLVSASVAAGIALGLGVNLIPVHHLEGHLLSPFLTEEIVYPFIMLLVSGGHTLLVKVSGYRKYDVLGGTLDDSAGECLDKSAKLMGLSFPGGPAIEQQAVFGDPLSIPLPHPLKNQGFNFSFSGLKTAIRRKWDQGADKNNLCASVQAKVIEVLLDKALYALKHEEVSRLIVVGGVSANKALRKSFLGAMKHHGYDVIFPDMRFATDNAAMIAQAASMMIQESVTVVNDLKMNPRWPLDAVS
ncbi:MAG TPA: tRNA (adenosine(37)-N6)-threonylcarbamoyltransferase complex transferase subunit TsaD [Gammaproteobacteria bacterium]|nr:tRNA (adenosine(37)-N6)-threonylcarbamoyltransferase complex transferase subunit TsaD [Gammaproteobacteria bacterium]